MRRADRLEGRHHAARRKHVVVLDHGHVVEPEAVVDAAAAADGVLLQRAPAREGLAGVEHPGLGALERRDPVRRGGGDPREVRGEVEGGPLGGEQTAGGPEDPHHRVARLHVGAVGEPVAHLDRVAHQRVEGRGGDAQTGHHAALPGVELGRGTGVLRDGVHGT